MSGKHKTWLWVVIVVGLVVAVGSPVAWADGYLISEETGTSSVMADQKAIMVYGEGHEDLVISIGLDLGPEQNQQDMAWIIPVPSRPEVQITDDGLFDLLDQISAPEIVYETEQQDGFSWGLGAAPPDMAVELLERKQVGVYDVAVLTGEEAGALLTWLQEEGFNVPEALLPPLEAYIAEGWTFVAMRIAPEAGSGQIQDAQPVWLSFDAEQMVYPMRLTAAHGEPLALRLYILADHRYELEGFGVEFAGRTGIVAPDPAMAPLLARQWFFTKLFNPSVTPAEMAADLTPHQAAADEPYRETIVHTYVSTGMGWPGAWLLELLCPCGLCWLGLVLLLVVIVIAIVLLKRRQK